MSDQQIDQLSINTIRTLCIDAVQQANSGHPGAPMADPMGMARSGLAGPVSRAPPESPDGGARCAFRRRPPRSRSRLSGR